MRRIRDIAIGVILVLVVAGAIRGLFFNDSKKETAPTEATRQEVSAPAAVESTPAINIPAAAESQPAVTPSGSADTSQERIKTLQLFIEGVLTPAMEESFPGSYDIVIVDENEIMVTLWSDDISSDIDAIRAGDENAIKAWQDFSTNDSLSTSDDMTMALREFVPGANVTVVVVDARNHDDVLLVTSHGFLYYDFYMDEGLDPFYLYNQQKERNGNP